MSDAAPTLLDRTLGNLRRAWRDIAASTFGQRAAQPKPDLPDDDAQRVREQMQACLSARGGEVSARARAAELGRTYLGLNGAGRQRFLKLLAGGYDVDRAAVDAAVERYAGAATQEAKAEADQALRQALEPPRRRLLTQFNALPEGVKFLVDLRAELAAGARADIDLAALEADLKALLAGWFDVGFLELRQITWNAPAALLEKLIAYEAVHEIRSWTDLKNRLDSDRRCFAFFHPRMPDEPLIFVEVALVSGMAGNIQALLDERAPVLDAAKADTAIFYSISNAQKGLNGISFGNFLIKRVVDRLAREFAGLKTFATLSPIPGFLGWLQRRMEAAEPLLLAPERKAFQRYENGDHDGVLLGRLLARPDWQHEPLVAEALRAPLMRLCAQYLLGEKVRGGERALDPVAHFHLTNGARVERLNWLGDTSAQGLRQSAGLMVNYRYKLDAIEANHEAYTGEGTVSASSALRALSKA
jgi:malonyl-CoA decarboxylase